MDTDELIKFANPNNFLMLIALVILWKQYQKSVIGNKTLIEIKGAIERQNERHDSLRDDHKKLEAHVNGINEKVTKHEYIIENHINKK